MKATFPFAYKAQALFPRSDTPKDDVFIETLTVDIPELQSGDVPVALEYVTLPGPADETSVCLWDDVFLSISGHRAYGSLELSALGSQSCGSPPSLIVETQHLYGSKEYSALWSWYKDPKQSQSGRDPAKVREWFHSDRDDALRKASWFYENLVAIDGTVWLPISEPKVGVYVGQQPSIGICLHDIGYENRTRSNVGHPLFYPAFHITETRDALAHIADKWPGAAADHAFDPERLNILIPEAFRFDKGDHALEWAALDAFDTLCKDIRHVPDRAMADWMALRALLENRDIPEWNHETSRLLEKTIPFVRNGLHRKQLASMLELWADHDIVDIAVNRRTANPRVHG